MMILFTGKTGEKVFKNKSLKKGDWKRDKTLG
jgi:hypothetical protein